MKETIANIVEKINFKKKVPFGILLGKCVHISNDQSKSTYAIHDNVVLKLDVLYEGLNSFVHEFGKDRKYEMGVEALSVICEEIGVEIDKDECFLLYHIRNLGKFRMKEAVLHSELKNLWKTYPEYEMTDQNFSYALKDLMRKKFIEYRKGSIYINNSVLIRYKSRAHLGN